VKFGNEEQYIKTPPPPPLPQPNPSYANTNNEEKKDEKEVVKRSLNVNYVYSSRGLKCLVPFPACCQIGNFEGFWNKVRVK